MLSKIFGRELLLSNAQAVRGYRQNWQNYAAKAMPPEIEGG